MLVCFFLSLSLFFLTFFHEPDFRLWRTSCWILNCSSFSRRFSLADSDSLPKPKRARVVSVDDRPLLAVDESAGWRRGPADWSIIVRERRRPLAMREQQTLRSELESFCLVLFFLSRPQTKSSKDKELQNIKREMKRARARAGKQKQKKLSRSLALFHALFLSPSPQATTPRTLTRRTPPSSRNAHLAQASLPGAGTGKERTFRPKRGGRTSLSIC